MSPEQYNSKKYGFKSDIWAFGCCLYEITNLKHAFEGHVILKKLQTNLFNIFYYKLKTWNAVALKVLKGNHAPVNSIYSKELKTLIDLMLSVNPKNRPTISYILERPFIKKRLASYIFDFIQSYTIDANSEKEEIHIEILKEQAEKLGVFNQLLLKDINPYDESSEKAIKQLNESKEQNFVSYISYLNKKQEEKKKIEDKILELERQKKLIYANIRGRDIKKNTDKDSSSIENRYYYENLKLISGSVEKKKAIGKIDRENIKRNPKKITEDSDEFIKIKSNIGINNNSNILKRPESVKKSYRIPSAENKDEEEFNQSYTNINSSVSKTKIIDITRNLQFVHNSLTNQNDIEIINSNIKELHKAERPSSGNNILSGKNNINIKKDAKIINQNKRQTNTIANKHKIMNYGNERSGIFNQVQNNNHSNIFTLNNSRDSHHVQNASLKKDDSSDENILETIKEVAENEKINEDKTKIVELTNEIVRMQEYLDQMQNKIQVIEKQMINKDKSYLTKEGEPNNDDYNDSYLNSNEGFQYHKTNSAIDVVNIEVCDIIEESDFNNSTDSNKIIIQDDGSKKINERTKILKQ